MLDALRARKERFLFEEAEIALRPSVMMFITMNPGYPGRAELPESVKVGGRAGGAGGSVAWLPLHCRVEWCRQPLPLQARVQHRLIFSPHRTTCVQALFRPVSMAVPDLALICEIMLMAEGFQQSKLLSRKFIILYKLCEDLLSRVRGAWGGLRMWVCRRRVCSPERPGASMLAKESCRVLLLACTCPSLHASLRPPPCRSRATTTGSCAPSRPRCTWRAA